VNNEVPGGHATKELSNGGSDHAAWTGHALHLGNYLFNFRDNVQGQRGNGRIECIIVEPHVPNIAVFICDVGVGSTKAGSFQVSLRCIDTDHMRPRLGQGFRQHTCPTGYIEHVTARSDIDAVEKLACQMLAPAPHESLVDIGISPIIS